MHEILNCFRPDLFRGKAVLVTGGSSGIGLAIAQGFARAGASVIALGSSESKLAARRSDETCAGIDFRLLDVRDAGRISTFCESLGSLDVLVNAAGIARPEAEFEEEIYNEVIEINLNSQMRFAMGTLPFLKAAQGSILNIASMLSYAADPAVPAYGASKAGVLGLTRQLAHAFGPSNLRVNAISPGYHKTEMTKGFWTDETMEVRIRERSALKRWGTVDDLVGAALFLSSPAAAFITGADLVVDGGFIIASIY